MMDLGTVWFNCKTFVYSFLEEALEDLSLVWSNCKLYNSPDSYIYSIAVKLEGATEGYYQNHLGGLVEKIWNGTLDKKHYPLIQVNKILT